MSDVKTGRADVDRLMKLAHRLEQDGRLVAAQLTYEAASEISRYRQITKQAVYDALRHADAGPVPADYARDHGYPAGTHGYVTDNDWHAFRTEAVMVALSTVSEPPAAQGNETGEK